MEYRLFGKTGEKVSSLGFGCMRFPTDSEGNIAEKEAIKMIHYAIDNGVNYFDTAYFYHNGKSEELVGKALKDGLREKVFIATKMPVALVKKEEDFDIFFNEQLRRLDTDYVDFYLLHALDKEGWKNVVIKYDFLSKIKKLKEDGKIRHIGFSFHDDYDTFKMIVDSFDEWEFCQIQLNYVDTEHQAGIRGLEYAHSKGLGVVIMEPLRGGKLANVPERIRDILPKDVSNVETALDFLWDRKEVSVILSGMSTFDQVRDNITYANRATVGMMCHNTKNILEYAKEVYRKSAFVPCTACGYCMPCPAGIDIPKIYDIYNKTALGRVKNIKEKEYDILSVKADKCVKCKKCEGVCPQQIESSVVMEKIAKVFE